jgi:hypothetical protein
LIRNHTGPRGAAGRQLNSAAAIPMELPGQDIPEPSPEELVSMGRFLFWSLVLVFLAALALPVVHALTKSAPHSTTAALHIR